MARRLRILMFIVILVVAIPLLWVADHWAFPASQATMVNYCMVSRGMSKETVQALLGYGIQTDPQAIPDPTSDTGTKPIVSGTKVMLFFNLPPPTPFEGIYVGFVNDIVVDKAWYVDGAEK